jgi:putative endonuclease
VTSRTQDLGLTGERIAERWMTQRGWRVLYRRYRSGRRDIDLVMERNGVVAFVEVKTRSNPDFGGPVGAVNWKKQMELCRAAFTWIDRFGRSGETYRFDVIGVLIEGQRVRVRHVENAFDVKSSA